MTTAQAKREMGPIRIKEHILQTVSAFTEQRAHDDDVTLVVMKWKGSDSRGERAK
jgi:serine phosphatase RsbU (regulator of sigma subunit)